MDLVTVIVPAYNAGTYLNRCVDSILCQTFENLEIILVNDGSSDETGTIIEKYRDRDSRIVCIHQDNQGLSSARNAGLRIMHGNLVTFVDADDYLAPNAIALLAEVHDRTGCSIVVGDYRLTEEETVKAFLEANSEGINLCEEGRVIAANDAVKELLIPGHIKFITAWGKLFESALFHEISFPEGKLFEDAYVNYRLYDLAGDVAVIDEVVYAYYQSSGSIMRSPYNEQKIGIVDAYRGRYLYYLEKKDTEMAGIMLRDYYFRLLKARGVALYYDRRKEVCKQLKEDAVSVYSQAVKDRVFEDTKDRIKAFVGRYFIKLYVRKWGNMKFIHI